MTTEAANQGQSGQSSQGQASQSQSGGNGAASESNSSQASQSSQQGGQQSQQQAEPAKRPAYVPEAHWDGTAGKIKDEGELAKFVNDHVAFKAAEDSRRATLPAKAEDYKIALPKDFKPPQGVEFKPNENDPLAPQARAFAVKHGLSQEGFEELVGLKAAIEIGNKQQVDTFKAAEAVKLGATAQPRMDAVTTWIKATVGDDLGKDLVLNLLTARQFEGFEKIIGAMRAQGQAGYDNRNSEVHQVGKVSDEEYRKMSPGERHEYAKKFPQPQLNGGR